ncbi:MAG: class I SAM-dependent methyltransferase [Gammaproteobacteria bacterium]|jgi:SAM-dependent methyltransferase
MAKSDLDDGIMNAPTFDEAYYERYYIKRATRVAEPVYFANVARLIEAYCGLLEIDVRSVLDLGCGIGSLKKPLAKSFPKADYTGVDISPYVCAKYGWELAAVDDYRGDAADLVVCHDVVQYLPPGAAKAAIRNLAEHCNEVLFFSVLTREDWEGKCDKSRTDSDVYLRDASWYRSKLSRHFRNLGGGLYLSRSSEIAVYALEHLD